MDTKYTIEYGPRSDTRETMTPRLGAALSGEEIVPLQRMGRLLARWRERLTKYTGKLRTALESGNAEEINVLNARCSEIGNAIRDLEGAGEEPTKASSKSPENEPHK